MEFPTTLRRAISTDYSLLFLDCLLALSLRQGRDIPLVSGACSEAPDFQKFLVVRARLKNWRALEELKLRF